MNLAETIEFIGKENFIFFVPMKPIREIGFISFTSSEDPTVIVPCTISEERYKIENKYKTTLKSMYKGFESKHFYFSDLEHLINNKEIKMYIDGLAKAIVLKETNINQ